MPELAALTAALRAMLPVGAGVGAADTQSPAPLWPGEDAPGAVPARLREYAAGRAAARLALTDLGHPPSAIPMRADRAPQWPAGVGGSITHSGTVALAAVVRAPTTLGIDIEPEADLPADVIDLILTPEERVPPRDARIVFSAKEAFFKAQHPRTGQMIGFDAVTVSLSADGFVLTIVTPLPGLPAGTRLAGRWAVVQGHILTALVIG